MSILVNNQEMNPIMYALKVLIVLGDATGTYKIDNKEFKLFKEFKKFKKFEKFKTRRQA